MKHGLPAAWGVHFTMMILSPQWQARGAQVVLMNQVTTKVLGDDQAKMVPALGARPAGPKWFTLKAPCFPGPE